MDRVLAQMIGEFDWRLTALAGLVCVLIGTLALVLLRKDRAPGAKSIALSSDRPIGLSDEKLRVQNMYLDAALNNMSQGVCMLDANAKIVVFNRRFLEMYALSPQVVKAGCSLRELIDHRIEVGLLDI